MSVTPDPVALIRAFGLEEPWDYELLRAVIQAYLRAAPRRRAAADRMLPGLATEAEHWRRMRSRLRRN